MNSTEPKKNHEPARRAPRNPEKRPAKKRGFFRSLVSHVMVAIIAVLGVSAYVHWNELLNYTGSRVCSYNVLGKYAPQAPKVPPLATPGPVQQSEAKTPATKPVPAPERQSDTEKKAPLPKDNAAVEPAQKKTEKSPDQKPAPAEPDVKLAENLQAELEVARKLFWAKDKGAVAAYEALVNRYPQNPALKGELGNVYFKNGDREKASDMYLAAGKVYSSLKNDAKKAAMVKILEKLDPKKAAILTDQPEKAAN